MISKLRSPRTQERKKIILWRYMAKDGQHKQQ